MGLHGYSLTAIDTTAHAHARARTHTHTHTHKHTHARARVREHTQTHAHPRTPTNSVASALPTQRCRRRLRRHLRRHRRPPAHLQVCTCVCTFVCTCVCVDVCTCVQWQAAPTAGLNGLKAHDVAAHEREEATQNQNPEGNQPRLPKWARTAGHQQDDHQQGSD